LANNVTFLERQLNVDLLGSGKAEIGGQGYYSISLFHLLQLVLKPETGRKKMERSRRGEDGISILALPLGNAEPFSNC
jgi:hypothetical protein